MGAFHGDLASFLELLKRGKVNDENYELSAVQ